MYYVFIKYKVKERSAEAGHSVHYIIIYINIYIYPITINDN